MLNRFNLYKSFYFRKLIVNSLGSRRVVENRIYQWLHKKKISRTIDRFNSTPPALQIEVTTSCNSDCVMCPHKKLTRPKGHMDFELYKKIIAEATDWSVPLVQLSGFGETLMDRRISDRVRYAKDRSIPFVRLNTNGSLMNSTVAEDLVSSGIDEILISVDHGKKEEYEAIRRNLNFDTVSGNISYLVEIRNKNGNTKPAIGINAVAQDKSLNQVQSVYERFSSEVDYITFQTAWNWTGSVKTDTPLTNKNRTRFPCPYPWHFLNVSWNGDVSICCTDYDNAVLVGNITDQTLYDVWHSREYSRLRAIHMAGAFHQIPVCQACNNAANWWIRY